MPWTYNEKRTSSLLNGTGKIEYAYTKGDWQKSTQNWIKTYKCDTWNNKTIIRKYRETTL
jgi:hypothetical protein